METMLKSWTNKSINGCLLTIKIVREQNILLIKLLCMIALGRTFCPCLHSFAVAGAQLSKCRIGTANGQSREPSPLEQFSLYRCFSVLAVWILSKNTLFVCYQAIEYKPVKLVTSCKGSFLPLLSGQSICLFFRSIGILHQRFSVQIQKFSVNELFFRQDRLTPMN